jgi:hypothetical protein
MQISVAPLYNGQPFFGELVDMMARPEFDVYGLAPEFVKSGRMLQIDDIFFSASAKSVAE